MNSVLITIFLLIAVVGTVGWFVTKYYRSEGNDPTIEVNPIIEPEPVAQPKPKKKAAKKKAAKKKAKKPTKKLEN